MRLKPYFSRKRRYKRLIMTTSSWKIKIAEAEDSGIRIDKWIAGWSELSRAKTRQLIETGEVRQNGDIITNPRAKVVSEAEYGVHIPPPIDDTPMAENIPLDICYEDDHLIVINKPSGMTVHPAPGSPNGTLVNALLYHAKDSLSGINGVKRPGIVHRIDKDTSGLLVVAKTDRTHRHLSKQFAAHTVHRRYICFVRGGPSPRHGRIESRLARAPHDRKRQAVVKDTLGDMEASEHGRHAVTNYALLKGYGQNPRAAIGTPLFAKVECRLETGRTHQIRVHMTHIGCPLLGDPLYGRQKAYHSLTSEAEINIRAALDGFNRQALHAASLGFIHPISKEQLEFEQALPDDIAALEAALLEL